MDSNNLPGFDPRVQEQLSQISLDQRSRRPSQSSQSSHSQVSSYYSTQSTQIHPRSARNPRNTYQHNQYSQPQAPPGLDAFPPLGSRQVTNPNLVPPQHQQPVPNHYQMSQPNQRQQSAAQEFFSRARGRGRGRANGSHSTRSANHVPNDHTRPPPNDPRLFNPNSNPHFAAVERQRQTNQRMMEQVDYIGVVASRGATNMLSREEINAKRDFTQRLHSLAKNVVYDRLDPVTSSRPEVRLEPYGSLANSFGTTGCDVDLLLTIQYQPSQYAEVTDETKRGLEKALLDQGIGARLLTNTRIPILRVCERPSNELLRNLRQHRANWEAEVTNGNGHSADTSSVAPLPILSEAQEVQQAAAVTSLDANAASVALPDTPTLDHTKLEYAGDCGIQCDVNFTNHIALHNTRLLWTYGQCDPRVRMMGIFVKNWAKARDINTPYRGTLSSYGYILMVLHYLINVAHPPVLPNLQEMAKSHDWNQSPTSLFEGHDVRFERDLNRARQYISTMPRNQKSLGGLLIGFFRYYGFAPSGFRWTEQTISIRTLGGIVTKQDKGWTRAKWSDENPNVRQRYLLAIEDPFEIDHNVARTVGHHGLVAIRDEFRRAWNIIDTVRCLSTPQGPIWTSEHIDGSTSGNGLDFLKPADDRGDLLRKDADVRRDKARQMRQELEATEELRKKHLSQGGLNVEGLDEENGMWYADQPHVVDETDEVVETLGLIHNWQHQDEKTSRMRSKNPERKRLDDYDNADSVMGQDDAICSDQESDLSTNQIRWGGSRYTAHHDCAPEQRLSADVANDWGAVCDDLAQQPPVDIALEPHPVSRSDRYIEPTSAADAQQIPTVMSHVHHHDPWSGDRNDQSVRVKPNPNLVGGNIAWTTNSKAGLWLLKRDELIRSGTWKSPTATDFGRLHTRFPYNPDMTKQQLKEYNYILETQYKKTLYPSRSTKAGELSSEAEKVLVDLTNTVSDNSWGAIKQDLEESKDEADLQSWPVTQDIPWSAETETGAWLLWRDQKCRLNEGYGNVQKWNGLIAKLDEIFPYKSVRTLADVECMNLELATHFGGLQFPRSQMPFPEQRVCAHTLHSAIEYTLAARETHMSSISKTTSGQIFTQVYPVERHSQDMSVSENGFEGSNPLNRDTGKAWETATQWSLSTEIGRWLQKRDEKIVEGSWRFGYREDSVFAHITKLYPYTSEVSASERDKQNQELETFFSDVWLPRDPANNAESVYRAILKVWNVRRNTTEANREPKASSRDHQANKDQGCPSARAVKTNDEVADFVREKRLAFFQQATAGAMRDSSFLDVTGPSSVVESAQKDAAAAAAAAATTSDVHSDNDAHFPARKDSAAEGSWNFIPSPSTRGSPIDPNPSQRCANNSKPIEKSYTSQASPSMTSKQLKSSTINQISATTRTRMISTMKSAPSSENDSTRKLLKKSEQMTPSGEVQNPCSQLEVNASLSNSNDDFIANSLKPNDWRTDRKDRFENPDILPIVRALDFEMDPVQLRDIEIIKAGGNGCARGGYNPFMLESDQYSWGGGGAMAQRSNSLHWSWTAPAVAEQAENDSECGQLLQELPGFVDL
ncbi:hypothetical protein LTS08_004130 [Lithohypha guttulata]|nr:hypothetical protein LTS08_004130 [Lithohypha guttulata]